jgi:hypothetical protein
VHLGIALAQIAGLEDCLDREVDEVGELSIGQCNKYSRGHNREKVGLFELERLVLYLKPALNPNPKLGRLRNAIRFGGDRLGDLIPLNPKVQRILVLTVIKVHVVVSESLKRAKADKQAIRRLWRVEAQNTFCFPHSIIPCRHLLIYGFRTCAGSIKMCQMSEQNKHRCWIKYLIQVICTFTVLRPDRTNDRICSSKALSSHPAAGIFSREIWPGQMSTLESESEFNQ